jgi:hypothetical protein
VAVRVAVAWQPAQRNTEYLRARPLPIAMEQGSSVSRDDPAAAAIPPLQAGGHWFDPGTAHGSTMRMSAAVPTRRKRCYKLPIAGAEGRKRLGKAKPKGLERGFESFRNSLGYLPSRRRRPLLELDPQAPPAAQRCQHARRRRARSSTERGATQARRRRARARPVRSRRQRGSRLPRARGPKAFVVRLDAAGAGVALGSLAQGCYGTTV